MNTLRIAIQAKGKLSEPSINFLSSRGFVIKPKGRNCVVPCENADLEVLFLRDDDIPHYVEQGIADLGIVGENVLFEKSSQVQVCENLGFGACSLVIAVLENSLYARPGDLEGKIIATSYPNVLNRFLKKENIRANIVRLKGSVEIAPQLGLADGICDLSQTGQTLRENNLRAIATIMESQAVLIRSPFKNEKITAAVERLFATI